MPNTPNILIIRYDDDCTVIDVKLNGTPLPNKSAWSKTGTTVCDLGDVEIVDINPRCVKVGGTLYCP